MLPDANVIIAAYISSPYSSNKRNCAYSNNSRHRIPITITYIKTYESVKLSDVVIIVTAPVAERDQETALSRTTSDTTTARQETVTLTAHEIEIARRSNCALSNDKRHAATSASSMTVTHPQVYKSGKLSNYCRVVIVTASVTEHDCQNAPPLYIPHKIPTYENVMLSNVASSLIVTAPV